MPPAPKTYKTIRLPYVTYGEPGLYFLTLVTHERRCIFGEIVEGVMRLNAAGQIVLDEWTNSAAIRQELKLDEFVIMPNHLHGLVLLNEILPSARRAALQAAELPRLQNERSAPSISSFIAGFKAAVTKRIRIQLGDPNFQVWQPRFHDHVIRADRDLEETRFYIRHNPQQWHQDRNHPDKS